MTTTEQKESPYEPAQTNSTLDILTYWPEDKTDYSFTNGLRLTFQGQTQPLKAKYKRYPNVPLPRRPKIENEPINSN